MTTLEKNFLTIFPRYEGVESEIALWLRHCTHWTSSDAITQSAYSEIQLKIIFSILLGRSAYVVYITASGMALYYVPLAWHENINPCKLEIFGPA